jgi:septal ring factor EnvC (AmiA/AmiB activator)
LEGIKKTNERRKKMGEMTLQEAINQVQTMANFFKAFKKIEEVVNVAAGLEQNIKELELKRSQIQSNIPELEKKRDELTPLVASLEKELKEKESTLAAVNAQLASLKARVS